MPEDFVPRPFRCEVQQLDGVIRVRPEGDLDMRTVPEVDDRLREAFDGSATLVIVDLSGLRFMDSTGLTLLARWNNASRRDGFDFALVKGHERIHRLFTLTGMHEYFSFTAG
jgi:anti-sigma B factor antagonist